MAPEEEDGTMARHSPKEQEGVAAGAGSEEITPSTSNRKQKANWKWVKAMNT